VEQSNGMKRVVSAVVVIATMAIPSGLVAQDSAWNRYTLEDLGGVFVRIEANEACAAAGIAASAFEADVSLKLIEAEVGVLTQAEMLNHQAMPELRISLDCANGSNTSAGAVAYSVGLRVQQAAQMLRDTQITLPEAVTWYSSEIGVSSAGGAADTVRAVLIAKVDAFAEAWAAVHAAENEGM
jgi:hypothetical protein